jgi:hypothetical protein
MRSSRRRASRRLRPNRESNPLDNAAFRRWFGESKVVDERGAPLVVWHGSMAPDFTRFDLDRVTDAWGIHFGTREAATTFTSPAIEKSPELLLRHVRPFYLSLRNPLLMRDEGEEWLDGVLYQLRDLKVIRPEDLAPLQAEMERVRTAAFYATPDARFTSAMPKAQAKFLRDLLLRLGYDGVRYENRYEDVGSTSWIAFLPTQIKSATDNVGTYDPNDPDIKKNGRRITPRNAT